jgi:hypothetical protein
MENSVELTPLKLAGTVWLAWGVYWFIASRSVKRDASAEPVLRRAQHIALQVLAFALTFGLVPGVHVGVLPWSVEWAGLLLTVAALALGVWARVHLGAYWSGRSPSKKVTSSFARGRMRSCGTPSTRRSSSAWPAQRSRRGTWDICSAPW